MKVLTDAAWMSPCTLLVERDWAVTLPASCLVAPVSGMRSWKLVSMRLNAVVCELAMLPEMFSSANDCARMPVTEVVRAPKIPMTCPPRSMRHVRPQFVDGFASRVPQKLLRQVSGLREING